MTFEPGYLDNPALRNENASNNIPEPQILCSASATASTTGSGHTLQCILAFGKQKSGRPGNPSNISEHCTSIQSHCPVVGILQYDSLQSWSHINSLS